MKGLRVKDSYIQLQARNIYNEMHGDSANSFTASSGWLDRFKTRKKLLSVAKLQLARFQRTHHKCVTSHYLIEKHDIQNRNIVNRDQVPRYFETEAKSTITTRGSREVLLQKGGSSHKRFTATFSITAEGKFLQPHIPFHV
ncbi:Hypothetical protein PHPALM_11053 [Phytophthora palmivora]|uniref:HTH CENPB-type domain-containing protein n=1 Tax=Phytophthora palmivora TaxID=4796 RepID=A0A2P4Y370_9STRA|nr:Hypothetical protein PHPALM_11053 [Phytophthora palmivora]